jgi:hypothetical protein
MDRPRADSSASDSRCMRWVAIRPSNRIWRELQNVIKWLVQIQQPELFQAINTFSLKNANEPPTLTLELEVARWYASNP